ncbi:hypothetical protein AU197_17325 [Mycobacterium sp. IS-1590]|uniref:hypothetical protein n=1 Tax=Mycobacterium sp. IS-1590 TaxID=1772286 RepID=UPI00074A37DA|nr:hypothetical protein [Mycobacterium sp. IS-1590]KUI39153.1 hypothetical protein AU197_17325 [Mycobacterium sp. IS-1590]
MLGLTVRSAVAAIAVAAAALSSAPIAAALPQGPCQDVPFVGVCTPYRGATGKPSSNAKSEPPLPVVNSAPPASGGQQAAIDIDD